MPAKPFVFVLMPFEPEFENVYMFGIKPACEEAGAVCERVDEQIFTETILTRIYNQIAIADVIVADMTGRNANVFYEVGFAHALHKKVVLLACDTADIPYDLRGYRHIVYEHRLAIVRSEVTERVRWCINNIEVPAGTEGHFKEKTASLGHHQEQILTDIRAKTGSENSWVTQGEIEAYFADLCPGRLKSELYYRLEELHLRGFLQERRNGHSGSYPRHDYRLSDSYRRYLLAASRSITGDVPVVR